LSSGKIPLKQSPLHRLHLELSAKMVPFAGYEMPLNYPAGIIKEHLHVRAAAGLFDVSHMGQLSIRAHSGNVQDAARALEALVPSDILGLAPQRQRYALFTNDAGGILDDLMVANLGSHLFLIVNAACKDADEARVRGSLVDCEVVRMGDRALLALQGPAAESVLSGLVLERVSDMRFLEVRSVSILGAACIVSRSGYTGEDGFEISIPVAAAESIARALMEHSAVAPAGLGARDSLRLEAGLCLYGSDLDPTTTPIEAGLEWTIQKCRRSGGDREGGFPGAATILRELAIGSARKRVGLRPEGRAPVRRGAELYDDDVAEAAIGHVTSGVFSPTLQAPIAMGYVARADAAPGAKLLASVRGQRLPVRVTPMPFVPHRYKRG
jgi:aminomethyltransferase